MAASQTYQVTNQLDSCEARWFALYTPHRREKLVDKRLKEQGIISYVPLLRYTRRYSRKVRQVELPLINGYVFAKITRNHYVPVLETPDVINFVKFNKNLIAIPDAEIKLLQRIVGEGIDIETSPITSFLPGDQVEIIAGNLTGIKGKFLKKQGKNFIVELVNMGFALLMEVDPSLLEKV